MAYCVREYGLWCSTFFTNGEIVDSEDAIRLFIAKTGSVQIRSASFFSGYGFLSADSIPMLNINLSDSVFGKQDRFQVKKSSKRLLRLYAD